MNSGFFDCRAAQSAAEWRDPDRALIRPPIVQTSVRLLIDQPGAVVQKSKMIAIVAASAVESCDALHAQLV